MDGCSKVGGGAGGESGGGELSVNLCSGREGAVLALLCCSGRYGTERVVLLCPPALSCVACRVSPGLVIPRHFCFLFLRRRPFLSCTIVRLHVTAQELRGGAHGGPRGPQGRNAFALRETPRGEGGAPGDVPECGGCSHRSAPAGKTKRATACPVVDVQAEL